MDTRTIFEIKMNALLRTIMSNTLSGFLPLYLVAEYQKSGGTWVSKMLSEYLAISFSKTAYPKFEKAVFHGHILPTGLQKNVLCVFRDGRDCMVSSYYHMLFENNKSIPYLVKQTRQRLNFKDVNDVKQNLPVFIEYLFTEFHIKSFTRRNQFTWSEFVNAWLNRGTVQVKYEDLIKNTSKEMSLVISQLTKEPIKISHLNYIVEKYTFENQSKRKPGEEDKHSFLRKGQPGDWKNKFSREAAEVFHHYAGKELITLDYEKNSNWLKNI